MSLEFVRGVTFPGKIILLDGISGTGKTMIHRILDSYECNHPPKFSYAIEQVSISHYYNKLEKDAAISMLRLQTDQIKYDLQISREINLRKNDLSSILKSVKKFSYLKRLLSNDGEFAVTNMEKESRNIVIVTHQLLNATQIFEEAFGNKFINIHAIRHPFYLFNHWSTYIELLGASARDLTVWKNSMGTTIPWFFKDTELFKEYKTLSNGDKTIVCIIELIYNALDHHTKSINNLNYLCIEFEKFVLNPNKIIDKIDSILESNSKNLINRIFKEEKIPRVHINSGKSLPIYKRYGSNLYKSNTSHKEDYLTKLDFIESQTSKKYFDKFKDCVTQYENIFELWF